MRCISCLLSSHKMVPYSEQQGRKLLIAYLQFVIIAVSAVLHLHFMLMFQLLIQHQQLKQQLSQAIEEKHHALTRYRQLRNGFIRRKKRHWKNPERTIIIIYIYIIIIIIINLFKVGANITMYSKY